MTHHVLTVHYRSADWIDVQHEALRRFMPPDTSIVGSLEGVDGVAPDTFDDLVPSLNGHAGKLNLMAWHVGRAAADDDVLVFLDGDALPISPLGELIDETLGRYPLAAVVREENGDRQPHPSFAFTTAGYWRSIQGDWSPGHPWMNTLLDEEVTDVGGNLMRQLQDTDATWLPILRSHDLGDHPVFYGIYGSVVYHHGAGFRPRRGTRADTAAQRSTQGSAPTEPSSVSVAAARAGRLARRGLRRVGIDGPTAVDPGAVENARIYELVHRDWATLLDHAVAVDAGPDRT